MMTTRSKPKPTEAELAILRALWKLGPSTVREVHDELSHHQTIGYTTVLKLMQIMTEKGLVVRDETARAHVYSTTTPREKMQKQLVRDLIDKAFEGSAASLVMQALSTRRATTEELDEIRRILNVMEGES